MQQRLLSFRLIITFKILGPIFYQSHELPIPYQRIAVAHAKMKSSAGPLIICGLFHHACVNRIEFHVASRCQQVTLIQNT